MDKKIKLSEPIETIQSQLIDTAHFGKFFFFNNTKSVLRN